MKTTIEHWLCEIQGGLGCDCWERQKEFSAVGINDALEQAKGWAEDEGGHVTAISWSRTEIVRKS